MLSGHDKPRAPLGADVAKADPSPSEAAQVANTIAQKLADEDGKITKPPHPDKHKDGDDPELLANAVSKLTLTGQSTSTKVVEAQNPGKNWLISRFCSSLNHDSDTDVLLAAAAVARMHKYPEDREGMPPKIGSLERKFSNSKQLATALGEWFVLGAAKDELPPQSQPQSVPVDRPRSYGVVPWVRVHGQWFCLLQVSYSAAKWDYKMDPFRGKQEAGESSQSAAVREMDEESCHTLQITAATLKQKRHIFRDDLFHIPVEFDGDLEWCRVCEVFDSNRQVLVKQKDAGVNETVGMCFFRPDDPKPLIRPASQVVKMLRNIKAILPRLERISPVVLTRVKKGEFITFVNKQPHAPVKHGSGKRGRRNHVNNSRRQKKHVVTRVSSGAARGSGSRSRGGDRRVGDDGDGHSKQRGDQGRDDRGSTGGGGVGIGGRGRSRGRGGWIVGLLEARPFRSPGKLPDAAMLTRSFPRPWSLTQPIGTLAP